MRKLRDEIDARAYAFLTRRGAARRGGRSRGSAQKRDPLLYGITGFSATSFFQSSVGGGEPGIASGFGVATLLRLLRIPTATNAAGGYGTLSSVSWYHPYVAPGGALQSYVTNGAGSLIASRSRQFAASDVGRIFLTLMLHDGALLRHFVDRAELPGAPACTGLAQYAGAFHKIGAVANNAQFGGDLDILSQVAFRGVPSAAQIQDFFDRARSLGDLPTTIQGGTVTHRESVRDQLRGTLVTSGQTAPATLDDTITRAAADALARQGSPSIVTIDTSRDGRRKLGVLGMGPSTGLESAAGKGIAGSPTGFHVAFPFAAYAGSAANRYLVLSSPSPGGWSSDVNAAGTNLRVALYAGTSPTIINVALSATDLGRERFCEISYNGTAVHIYLDGQLVSTTAFSGYTVAASPFKIGSAPSDGVTVWGAVGGNTAHSLAQAQDAYAQWVATGKIPQTAGAEHLYDLTLDIIAAGETVPAQVLDRIGADHLTRVGGLRVTTTPANGIADFSSAHWIQSAGVTLPGATSGFYAEVLGYYVPGASAEDWFSCAAFAANAGWRLGSWNGYANIQAGDGSAAKGAQGNTLLPAGLNHLGLVYDGSVLKQYLNGTLYNTTVAFAYALGTLPANFGVNRPSAPVNVTTKSGLLGGAYGLIVPSDAQIAAAASAALSAGRIVGVSSHSQRYDLVQDVLDAGGKIPAIWRERVSGSNPMVTVGAPLQVAQRTERTWSYETSPIYRSVRATSTAQGAYRALSGPGAPGDAAGFWALVAFLALPTDVDASRFLFGHLNNVDSTGWDIRTTGKNALIGVGFRDSGAYALLGSSVIPTSEIGKIHVAAFTWDAPAGMFRPFYRRVAGSPQVRSGHVPATGLQLSLGAASYEGYSATDCGVLGGAYGAGVLTLAEYQAACDHIMSRETLIGLLPARDKSVLIDVSADCNENGGALPDVLKNRAPGATGNALSRSGTLSMHAQTARAYAW